MNKQDKALAFLAKHGRATNEEFYYEPELRELYVGRGFDSDQITKRIGYLIGSLRKRGFARTVTKGPPAIYEITLAGRHHLENQGIEVEGAPPLEAYAYIGIGGEPDVEPPKVKVKVEPPSLPRLTGKVLGVGIDMLELSVKDCPVQLHAGDGILGYILENDLLRKTIDVYIINNTAKWVEVHEFA